MGNPIRWKPRRGGVLVLAPHPDDETIACGGTLHLHARRGDAVKVVFLTDGAAGDPRGFYRGRDYAALRRREARKAAAFLGVSSLEFWNYPDGRLSSSRGVAERLAEELRETQPRTVYLPSALDAHPDHRMLARSFDAALKKSPRSLVQCRYEVWSENRPRALSDVSSAFPRKLAALKAYRSQLRYCDFVQRVRRLDAARALFLKGCRYAEALEVRAS